MLLTARLDNRERLRQIVLEEKAGLEAGLIPGGHGVVFRRLRAHFTEADWAAEQMGGVGYLFFLRRLIQRMEQDWPAVLADLEAVRRGLDRAGRHAVQRDRGPGQLRRLPAAVGRVHRPRCRLAQRWPTTGSRS